MRYLFLAPLLMLAAGCSHEVGNSLGDGYLHVDTDSYNAWVVNGPEMLVDSNVTHALAVDEFIVGIRVESKRPIGFTLDEISEEYGYFILDKKTRSLVQGLSESEARQIFQENGWNFSDLTEATL